MKVYTSNAEWPDCVKLGVIPNVSTDTHDSLEFAQKICDILKHQGFGCKREIFPIRTWVEKKEK